MSLKTTPLNRIHHQLGARMIDFAGWEMPVQYASALEEHHAVRRAVGVFDVSHMGRVEFRGPDALAFVQHITCNDVARLADGQAQYSAFLTEAGTFVDDIVVYRFHAERILICINAATAAKDLAWISDRRQGRIDIVDRSGELAQLAVQGPRAIEVLQRLTTVDLSAIRANRATSCTYRHRGPSRSGTPFSRLERTSVFPLPAWPAATVCAWR